LPTGRPVSFALADPPTNANITIGAAATENGIDAKQQQFSANSCLDSAARRGAAARIH
jgi:hypothetical protein